MGMTKGFAHPLTSGSLIVLGIDKNRSKKKQKSKNHLKNLQPVFFAGVFDFCSSE